MSFDKFVSACYERTILPAIAWENEAVRAALVAHDDTAVIAALDSEF